MSASPFSARLQRPPFNPRGRVVARRHVKLSREYLPGEDIPALEQVPERTLRLLWEQSSIDTMPIEAGPVEIAPTAKPSQQPKHHQQRR